MTTVDPSPTPEGVDAPSTPDSRRWWVLVLLCGLQAMILLDMTVVNVALPAIQADLGFTDAGLSWVVNGYILMAGGLLILGGRLADTFGRRRLLLIGVVVFAVFSALSGAAVTPWMMIVGRFGQGVAEALAAPASLGLIALLFTDPKERAKALGAWGGIIGFAGTIGYVLSGVLTQLASWHWLFFINLPVAAVILVLIPRLVEESRMVRTKGGGLDLAGAATLTLGLVAIVYGLLQAAEHPWGSATTLLPLGVGVVLIGVTVVVEMRAANPLIPLGFFADRTRSVINGTTLFFMASFISYSYLLTLFLQQVLGYSPLQGGLAWLPMSVAIGAGIGLGTALVPRVGVRPVVSVGFIGAGAGLLLTSTMSVDSSYLSGIVPGMVVFGVFAGAVMPAATNAALHRVTVQDSSLASGVQNTMQQIGSALGVAVLVTIALRFAGDALATGTPEAEAMAGGYALAFRIAAGLMVLGGVLNALLLERVDAELRDPTAESLETAR